MHESVKPDEVVERLTNTHWEVVNQWSDEYEPREAWENQVRDALRAHSAAVEAAAKVITILADGARPPQDAKPVAWQRRLKNVKEDVGPHAKGEWGEWAQCSPEQAAYALENGTVDGFPDYLQAEARPLYSSPPLAIEALREALKPFARVGEMMCPLFDGDNSPWVETPDSTPYGSQGLTFGDFRRAFEVIKSLGKD